MTITVIRDEVIGYINELPEEKLSSLLDYARFLRKKNHSWEATCIEDVYRNIEEGLDDLKHGRCEPFEDTMRDFKKNGIFV
ncbi:MAG: DUF2281 domain-containing protein [Defluviitaleaceae bacterium]|nr:DUF2281 domain-containing protein [Defluviitaleaceae bacterium]